MGEPGCVVDGHPRASVPLHTHHLQLFQQGVMHFVAEDADGFFTHQRFNTPGVDNNIAFVHAEQTPVPSCPHTRAKMRHTLRRTALPQKQNTVDGGAEPLPFTKLSGEKAAQRAEAGMTPGAECEASMVHLLPVLERNNNGATACVPSTM